MGKNSILTVIVLLSLFTSMSSAGEIVAWGNSTWDLNVPPVGEDFIGVSAGSFTNITLKSDGSVVVWGAAGNPPFDVPAEQDFIAISLGYLHVLAIRSDGSLAAWGNNGEGQCDVPDGNDFIAVAAGNWHSLALRDNGSIEAFGDNNYGQLDDTPEANDFIAVAAGHDSCLALRNNGSLAAWGWDYNGMVTDLPDENDFNAVAIGTYGVALRDDGTLVNWGTSYQVPTGNDFVAIEAGKYHCLALRADGSLVGWGLNAQGETDIPAIPAGYVFTDFAAGNGKNSVGLIVESQLYILTMSVAPNDIDINTVTPTVGDHNVTSLVSLNATRFVNCPDVYEFDHWEGDVNDVNEPNTTIIMDSNKTVTGVFVDDRQCGDVCHPYPPGDFNRDCRVNKGDARWNRRQFEKRKRIIRDHWLECTAPECD